MNITPAHLLAGLAWASLFALSWLLILDRVGGQALAFWIFFLIVAVSASAIAAGQGRD